MPILVLVMLMKMLVAMVMLLSLLVTMLMLMLMLPEGENVKVFDKRRIGRGLKTACEYQKLIVGTGIYKF